VDVTGSGFFKLRYVTTSSACEDDRASVWNVWVWSNNTDRRKLK